MVFSTLSRRVFYLNSPWRIIISRALKDNHQKKQLIDVGLLTEAKDYQEEIVNYFKLKEKVNNGKIIVYFTITTNCDLKCKYCFENHLERVDSHVSNISEFTRLLDRKLDGNKQIKKVEITLFGGEPLLRFDLCCLLLSFVKGVCLKHKIQYLFSMASNGIVAKEKKMNILKRYGLTDIQITFDGWGPSHDEIRKVDNKSGYGDLLKNVSRLGRLFNLTLKYNIRKQNINGFKKFLDDIETLNLKRFTIKLEALQPTLTDKENSFYFYPEDPKLANIYFKLSKIALESGMAVDISSALKPPCMSSAKNSFMIEPDGDISACTSSYKMRNLFLGNIKSAKNLSFDRKIIKDNILNAAASRCIPKKCPYFPICETGCLFVKEVRNMEQNIPHCREKYFEQLIPKLIELKNIS